MKKDVETHPSWGGITIGRRTYGGDGGVVFDSPIRHSTVIAITLSHVQRARDAEKSWIHATDQVIDVVMSEEQFARAITSLNCGVTPCTITRIGRGQVESPPVEDLMGSVQAGVQDSIAAVAARADAAYQYLIDLHASGKASKAQLAEAVEKVRFMRQAIAADLPFLAKCMTRAFDSVQTAARVEITGFIARQAARAGLSADVVESLTTRMLGNDQEDA